jgi:tetratricopeptide (TPR) repeat protein
VLGKRTMSWAVLITAIVSACALQASSAQAQNAGEAPAGAATAPAVPTDPNREVARQAYIDGTTAAEEARWADALRLFQQAYDLSHNPAALFNVATTLRALGRHRDARDAIDHLFRDHPSLPEELRNEALAMRTQEAARVATLAINNAPQRPDLTVRLDGRTLEVPSTRPIRLETDPGQHSVDLSADQPPELQAFHWEQMLADGELAIVNVDMPEVDHGSILASPWFWTVVGVVVIGAGVATYLYMNDKAQLVPGGDYQVSFPN